VTIFFLKSWRSAFPAKAHPTVFSHPFFPSEQRTEKHLDHKLMEIAALFCQASCEHPYHITRILLCQE